MWGFIKNRIIFTIHQTTGKKVSPIKNICYTKVGCYILKTEYKRIFILCIVLAAMIISALGFYFQNLIYVAAFQFFEPDISLERIEIETEKIKISDMEKDSRIFTGLGEKPYVYFVHSYYLKASDPSDVAATTKYGVRIDAAVERDNVFASQFHPEKSSQTGMKILQNFAAL